MIERIVGRIFQLVGRLRGGDGGRDLERVGRELVDLERRRAQRPSSER
ncbi:MAG TPA: hypothetical protein VML94_07105 [Thermoplasmata archaeon]|nr:hypothetical protein [Thermoplasmata archaeon]